MSNQNPFMSGISKKSSSDNISYVTYVTLKIYHKIYHKNNDIKSFDYENSQNSFFCLKMTKGDRI